MRSTSSGYEDSRGHRAVAGLESIARCSPGLLVFAHDLADGFEGLGAALKTELRVDPQQLVDHRQVQRHTGPSSTLASEHAELRHVVFEAVENHVQLKTTINKVSLPERKVVTEVPHPFNTAFGNGCTKDRLFRQHGVLKSPAELAVLQRVLIAR